MHIHVRVLLLKGAYHSKLGMGVQFLTVIIIIVLAELTLPNMCVHYITLLLAYSVFIYNRYTVELH